MGISEAFGSEFEGSEKEPTIEERQPLTLISPSKRDVVAAIYMYFNQNGKTKEELDQIIQAKIDAAVNRTVKRLLNEQEFNDMITKSVEQTIAAQKLMYDASGNSFKNHIRGLIDQAIMQSVVNAYKVTIDKREETS